MKHWHMQRYTCPICQKRVLLEELHLLQHDIELVKTPSLQDEREAYLKMFNDPDWPQKVLDMHAMALLRRIGT